MRKSILGLGLGIAALLIAVAPLAATAPDSTTIDDCVAKKSAVEFPHAAHFEVTECTTCHHTDEGLTADSGTAQPCGECHNSPESPDTPECAQMSLKKNPFHINCVGCHKEQAAGPAKCDECHPKAE